MRFLVDVQLREPGMNGGLAHRRMRELDFEVELLCDAPSKASAQARKVFNEASHSHGKGTLRAVSTGYSAGRINLVAEVDLDISNREESNRIAQGGAPRRATVVSRHSKR